MLILFLNLLTLSATAADSSSGCPIHTALDAKVHLLTNAVFHKASPEHKDPAQVSGFTMSDFDAGTPWTIQACGDRFCATPKDIEIQHHVYVRPEKLKGKLNPRWLPLELFPCGETPNKNYVTYGCTIEHEKVHVVQRDEAIQAACALMVEQLAMIRVATRVEAEREARRLYSTLIKTVATADQESVPYKIEWKCNAEAASKAGVVCAERPDWSTLPFLGGLGRSDESGGLRFEKDGQPIFKARFLGDATKLESTGPFESCTKRKEWFFSANRLDQENCVTSDGAVVKTFYEFGRKQRVLKLDASGAKVSQELLFDPRQRISSD